MAQDVDAVNGWGAAMMVAGMARSQRWLREQLPGVEAMLAEPGRAWLSAELRERLLPAA